MFYNLFFSVTHNIDSKGEVCFSMEGCTLQLYSNPMQGILEHNCLLGGDVNHGRAALP